jgi:hypothetical protein
MDNVDLVRVVDVTSFGWSFRTISILHPRSTRASERGPTCDYLDFGDDMFTHSRIRSAGVVVTMCCNKPIYPAVWQKMNHRQTRNGGQRSRQQSTICFGLFGSTQ